MPTYTKRQEEILERITDASSREYQTAIYDAANELYELIGDMPTEGLRAFVGDLVELENNELWDRALSKPIATFSGVARRAHDTLRRQGHSVHSSSCTVWELTKVIKDTRGIEIMPKGLEGAVIYVGLQGVSTVRDDCR